MAAAPTFVQTAFPGVFELTPGYLEVTCCPGGLWLLLEHRAGTHDQAPGLWVVNRADLSIKEHRVIAPHSLTRAPLHCVPYSGELWSAEPDTERADHTATQICVYSIPEFELITELDVERIFHPTAFLHSRTGGIVLLGEELNEETMWMIGGQELRADWFDPVARTSLGGMNDKEVLAKVGSGVADEAISGQDITFRISHQLSEDGWRLSYRVAQSLAFASPVLPFYSLVTIDAPAMRNVVCWSTKMPGPLWAECWLGANSKLDIAFVNDRLVLNRVEEQGITWTLSLISDPWGNQELMPSDFEYWVSIENQQIVIARQTGHQSCELYLIDLNQGQMVSRKPLYIGPQQCFFFWVHGVLWHAVAMNPSEIWIGPEYGTMNPAKQSLVLKTGGNVTRLVGNLHERDKVLSITSWGQQSRDTRQYFIDLSKVSFDWLAVCSLRCCHCDNRPCKTKLWFLKGYFSAINSIDHSPESAVSEILIDLSWR